MTARYTFGMLSFQCLSGRTPACAKGWADTPVFRDGMKKKDQEICPFCRLRGYVREVER